jgi:hypothetical protein
MPKPCPQTAFRQETPQELLEESDSGLRFPVVKVLSPLVVIPPGETASSLCLEANDVGGDKLELLLLFLCRFLR